ncbi:MAG TPA: hypothetical protein VJ716_08355 [Gaiellaceae bacterium]|nr:hypothetical protein [Gaiellaceae bacterium]
MIDAHLDRLLDELVAAEPRERWNDVVGRARHSRRRYAAVVAGIAVLVLTPATWAAVDAFEGTPAPESINQSFVQWNAGAEQMETFDAQSGFKKQEPRADASKAHGVLQLATSDGPLDMWAAPELDGNGTCWFVGWESDMHGDHALGEGSCTEGDDSAIDPSWGWGADHPDDTIMEGSVTGEETTLDVTLTDGRTTTLPVVEHLFLAALPRGSKPASIVGRDAAGHVVDTWTDPNP